MKQINFKKFLTLLALFSIGFTYAQRTVSGTVKDSSGEPLPGATVMVMGTTNGTTTDFDGNFTISVSNGETLVFSYVGFAPQELAVSQSTNFNVLLSENALDEVVVTALGISREKKSLGYAVTEVSGDNVNTIKDHNLASSLSGKVAGLNITQSGSVGAGSRIVIRGNNSIGGNTQALIVVDGIPINADGVNSGGSVYNSSVTGGGITDINPNDVESISVLKGPNAAALYGSRAGNGVILITTKKGTNNNRVGVTVNTNITFDDPMFLPDYQNEYGQGSLGAAFTDLQNDWGTGSWGSKLDGAQQLYYTGESRAYRAQPDNVANFFRPATKSISSISLDKASENGSIRFSYTNNSSESIMPNSDLNSHNFNLRGVAQLSDKLSIDSKATYFTQEVTNRTNLGGEGVLNYVYYMPRNVDVNDLKMYQQENASTPETLGVISYGPPGGITGNPYWMLFNDTNDERRSRFLGFTKINYEFTDWLSAFVRVGADITEVKSQAIQKPGHHFYPEGRLQKSMDTYTELNSEFLVTARKELTNKLNVVANLGGNLSKRTSEGLSIFGRNFKIPTKYFISNLNEIDPPAERPQAIKKVNSLYGSANLAYDNFLYLDVTARNDWSSTLAEENRSYLYNSTSLSAILNRYIDPSQELFNLIKVRGSWAEVGNDTDPYQLYQTFSVPGQGYLGLTTLSAPSVKLNPNLRPETVTSTEFGLEMSMLENRLSLDLSIYDMTTEDLIFNVPVPAATGYQFFKENVGEVTNKGIELVIGGSPVRTANFSWDTSIFMSKNKNELVELVDGLETIPYNTTNSGNLSLRASVGGGIGDIYGSVWDTDDNGNYLVNANGVPISSTPDNLLGNAQPDMLAGWSNTFSFGALTMSFLIDGRFGGQLYSYTSSQLDASGVSQRSLQYRDTGVTLDAINTNTNSANSSSITGQEYWGAVSGIAENYVYDQDNIRLRELSIGYQIPNVNLFGMRSAYLQLIGRNLFFFSKSAPDIDPESMLGTGLGAQGISANNLPAVRSIGFNVTMNF